MDEIMDDYGVGDRFKYSGRKIKRGQGVQLYNLFIENGSEPLKKEDIDMIMDDCSD